MVMNETEVCSCCSFTFRVPSFMFIMGSLYEADLKKGTERANQDGHNQLMQRGTGPHKTSLLKTVNLNAQKSFSIERLTNKQAVHCSHQLPFTHRVGKLLILMTRLEKIRNKKG